MTIVSGSGHRPDKLPNKQTGYILPNPTYNYICQQIEKHLLEIKPEKVISGMALGYDSYLASVAIKLNIPLVAAIPFEGQEKMWPEKSQKAYHQLLKHATEKIIVSPGGYSAYKMQVRNEYMVKECDILLVCFDESSGGTANCINYARSINKEIIIIDPRLA